MQLPKRWEKDNWRRHLVARARAQDVEDVLDVNKSPVTQEEKDLFAEKKIFICFVFERTLQTDSSPSQRIYL